MCAIVPVERIARIRELVNFETHVFLPIQAHVHESLRNAFASLILFVLRVLGKEKRASIIVRRNGT